MATAPDPTPIAGSEAAKRGARQFLRVRVKDQTWDVVPELEMTEQFVVRQHTGIPFTVFMTSLGEDSLFILWWLGRRQNGEPSLPYTQALKEWPTGLGPKDLELSEFDLDDEPIEEDTPEGSGPAS